MWIDTHAHLYSTKFDEDRKAMIQRMQEAKVVKAFMPNVDSETIDGMLALEHEYPELCYATMGLHPCSVKDDYKHELRIVEKQLGERPFVAVGEIGIDLYWDKSTLTYQKEAFRIQATWARELGIPIIIHARESLDILLQEVEGLQDGSLTGVFHCFTGNTEQAERIQALGFYMGIGGVVTFKKSGLADVVSKIPLKHIVLETDAPYLTPTPHRGKRNESAYIPYIGEKVAEAHGLTIEEVAGISTTNALNLYQLE